MRKLYLALFLCLLSSDLALGAETHGLFSIEDYYSKDTSSAYDFNFLTTRLRLDADKLNETGSLSFHFDGRERNNLSNRDYNSSIKNERIDAANIEYLGPAKRFYLSAGRLLPKELPAERVDGVNMVYQKETAGVGIFGGLKPDPYTDEFNSDYTTTGGYLFYRRDDLTASLSFIHNGFKGGTDRQYIYGQTTYSPVSEIRLFGLITADINPMTSDIDLTTAMTELSYRPVPSSGIAIGYNQFRAIRLFKSMNFDIVDSQQQSYYIRGDYSFLNRYSVYGRYERQSQYYRLFESVLRYSDTYQIGFRNDNLMDTGFTVNLSTTVTNSYSSTFKTYNMELSRFFMEMLQLVLNSSYMQSRYDINDYTDDVKTYGASGYLILGKRWNLSLSYEDRQAKDYTTNSVMSRISYKF